RRFLPGFLPAERRQVQKRPHAAERLDAPRAGEVGAVDLAAIVNENAEAEVLAVLILARARRLGADFEVGVEVALERGDPRDRPPHALSIGLDLGDRRARHDRERGVARVEMGEVADLIDEHRAAGTAGIPRRTEHEVVEDELAASLEELGESPRAVRAL